MFKGSNYFPLDIIITELNELKILICLKYLQSMIKKKSVFNIVEKLVEYLPCFCTNDVIDLSPEQL